MKLRRRWTALLSSTLRDQFSFGISVYAMPVRLPCRICRTACGIPRGRLIRMGNDGRDRYCSGERESDGHY
jgi:hypothetical protein